MSGVFLFANGELVKSNYFNGIRNVILFNCYLNVMDVSCFKSPLNANSRTKKVNKVSVLYDKAGLLPKL